MQVFDDEPTLLTTILFNTPAPLFTVLVVLVLMLENELVLNLLFNAANVDSVAAPVGSGKDAALIVTLSVPLAKRVKLTGTALALNHVS